MVIGPAQKINEPPHDKTTKNDCAPCEDSDQPGDPPSLWVKVFANKTSHFVASWYRPPGSTSEEFKLFREQLDYIKTHHKGKKLPSAHVLGDFNFKDIDWPDRLSKSGSTLSQSEGQILIDIMNDHGLEQMVHFPTREKNTLDLILTTLPGQFQDVHSPDKLSDHDIVSGTLKIFIPPIKKPRRKVYLYQKGDYESMRKDTLKFAKEKYFNGHSDTPSVQENFDLLTSFIQDSADKHIPSKTSRSVSSVPWTTPEIRRKIRRKNKTHAKAKKTGSSKLRSKFETLKAHFILNHLYISKKIFFALGYVFSFRKNMAMEIPVFRLLFRRKCRELPYLCLI